MLPNDWTAIREIATNTLDARIVAARGDMTGAIRRWRAAVAAEDKMHYHEPSDWYYPSRESLGAALLRNKQLLEAEQVFKKDLVKNPLNPRSLFGLCVTLERERNFLRARKYRQSFELIWKGDTNELHIEDF
jgi:Flp pilus assembly protein TadD